VIEADGKRHTVEVQAEVRAAMGGMRH